jgi:hypothetical protein
LDNENLKPYDNLKGQLRRRFPHPQKLFFMFFFQKIKGEMQAMPLLLIKEKAISYS